MQEKKLIFISHANPEDNYFAAWLTAKLQVLGYNAWVDLDNLSTGDSFNTVIKPIIQEQACLFIPITTENYCKKAKNQNSGVSRELNCAATVDTLSLGHNFIFPVRFDDVDYNDFPYHYIGWNTISFTENWQSGLIEIVKNLENNNISKDSNEKNPIDLWFNVIKNTKKAIDKKEKYYSNWFALELPKNIYIHEPQSFNKKEFFSIPYPTVLESNHIITFASKETINKYILILNSYELPVEKFLVSDSMEINKNFILKEPRKKIIRLLNYSFELHLKGKNMIGWARGNNGKNMIYYFKHNDLPKQISLKRFGKINGRRSLTGRMTEVIDSKRQVVNWAFAIGGKASVDPLPHFKITYSLVFTDEKFIRFNNEVHHKLRRSIPADWFNRKWFETLLASMLKISPSFDSKNIEITIHWCRIEKRWVVYTSNLLMIRTSCFSIS